MTFNDSYINFSEAINKNHDEITLGSTYLNLGHYTDSLAQFDS
ncbi:44314_t:CDS:2 [Gigaspora margarita]|uniref:44314_t:CDS:1 n=1 Tax=Gigaspora margarita TaxID=4874 RepID=A0ABN7UWU7_GIGMA|nr:44314_t:CDS:2 [Gigaspora margarita]